MIAAAALILSATAGQGTDEFKYSREEADRAFAVYSDCVVRQSAGEQRAIVLTRAAPGTRGAYEAARKLVYPNCLTSAGGQVKMTTNAASLRPAMFAALYRRRFGATSPASFDGVPPLDVDRLYDGGSAAYPAAAMTQLQFGNCVARTNPAGVHAFLMARPFSKAEDAAIPTLSTAMAQCLPANEQIRLSRSAARGVIAEAMYQLSMARTNAAVATTSPPKAQ